MSYWKESRYYKDEQMANAATLKKELPETGLLSAIRLQLYHTNASAIHNSNKARIIDHITKLEVTDGADKTMFSLRGQQVKALDFYEGMGVPFEKAILYGSYTQRTELIVPFGRFFKDEQYMLDLAAFDSVYLEITNDLSTTQCANNACKANINLLTLEDPISRPVKYMKSYEWRNEKPSGDGQYVYHELPTTEMIRRVMVQTDPDLETAGNATADPKGDSYSLKFTMLQDKEVVLDHRPKDLMRLNADEYGLVETRGRYYPSTTQYWDVGIGDVTNIIGKASKAGGGDASDYCDLEETNDRFEKAGSMSDKTWVDLIAIGSGYYHTMVLYDAKLLPEARYLNASKGGEGKGPVRIQWYGYKDDHTFRTCLTVPVAQGEF